jgi:predicted AlkP superfamily pyrophosphatase or phosphodiesterase
VIRAFSLLAALAIVVDTTPTAAGRPSPSPAAPAPRLLVLVVVDQLRADYLRLFDRHWSRGFRTLLDRGLVFDNARFPYLNTVTCAGHATIATGSQPRTHGLVLNAWWHRVERRTLDCTADPGAPDISYGRPARLGNSARRLAVPTLADALRAQTPGARVVTLSLKARSAITLAGHGGDAVVWFDDLAGSFVTSRAFAAAAVPEVKAFIDRNPYERDQGRTWQLFASPETYLYRDAGTGERPPAPWTGLFPHVVAGRSPLDTLFFDVWQTSPFADAYLGEMAQAFVDAFSLGQRDAIDYLAVSFSATDEVGHDFGPESRELEDTLRRLDVTLGALIAHLDARVGRERYVLVLASDHGVAPIAGFGRGGRIAPEDIRDRIEETLIDEFGPLPSGGYVDAVNFAYVYLAPGTAERLRKAPRAMAAVRRAVEAIAGVDRLLDARELNVRSSDEGVRAAAFSHFPDRSGDLIVIPERYWYMLPRNTSTATTHGTHHDYDAHVPVVFFGGGIPRGRVSSPITPADIAPTLARLAGIALHTPDGRVLREVVR